MSKNIFRENFKENFLNSPEKSFQRKNINFIEIRVKQKLSQYEVKTKIFSI